MKLTIENIKEWKELLDIVALDKMDCTNFSETESDDDWLFGWSGFTPEDVVKEEMSYWS